MMLLGSWESTCRSTGAAYDNASTQLALALLRSDTMQAYAQLLAADLAALKAAGERTAWGTGPGSHTCSTGPKNVPSACASATDRTVTYASGSCPGATDAFGVSAPAHSSMAEGIPSANADAAASPSNGAVIVASGLMHALEAVEFTCFLCTPVSYFQRPVVDHVLRGRLKEELLAALADSCLLEHVCKLRMALQEVAAAWPGQAARMAAVNSCLRTLLFALFPDMWPVEHGWKLSNDSVTALLARPPPLAPPQRAALRRVLSGPCLQLYLGWALAAPLSAAAGRPLYGLPRSLVPAGDAASSERGGTLAVVEAVRAGGEVWTQLLRDAAAVAGREASHKLLMPCPGITQQTSQNRPAANTSAQRSAGRLPYKLRNVVGLLLDAMRHAQPQPGEERLHMRGLQSAVRCVAAAAPWVRASTAASWLAGLWPMLLRTLHGMRPEDALSRALPAGRLLLAPLGEACISLPSQAGAGGPSPSLRAALDAGLVPALERAMRAAFGAGDRGVVSCQVPILLLELVLRRPGVWPALLAHGPQAQVASLIVTMRKMMGATTQNGEWTLWQMQLVALLEQSAALLQGPGGEAPSSGSSGPTAASAGSSSRGAGNGVAALGWAVAERYCRQLTANRGISGLGGAAAVDSAGGQGASTDSLVDGPSWQHILHAGGCPPPSSPAAEQQRRLAVFAATQWLPLLLTKRLGGQQSEHLPIHLDAYSPHRAYLVLYHWMMLMARGCCAARGRAEEERASSKRGESDSSAAGACSHTAVGTAAYDSWSSLFRSCHAPLQVASADELPGAALPMLDLGELLMAAAPGLFADVFADLCQKAGLHEVTPGREVTARLQRYKRDGLVAALQQFAKFGAAGGAKAVPPGWRPPAPGLAAAAALSRPGSWRPLPPPCEVGAEALGLVGSCANPACTVLAGASEAELGAAVACGKCGAARYCCVKCKKAHWRMGHAVECPGRIRVAGGMYHLTVEGVD